MFSIIFGGFIGGSLRGLMGIAKTLILKKDEQINYGWFFVSIAVAIAIGVIAAGFMGGGFKGLTVLGKLPLKSVYGAKGSICLLNLE